MRLIVLLTIPTFISAFLLPPSADSSPHGFNLDTNLESKCTFILNHRQQSAITYVQLNTIIDHANNLTINVALSRPAAAFNSYTRLDRGRAFAVAGLLDEERLSIRSEEGGVLEFRVGGVEWSAGGTSSEEDGRGKAWCEVGEWDGRADRRERRLNCAFPCEKVAIEDLDDVEYQGVGGEGQARILS